ncbi:hypothetical protein MJ575_23950 [Klebsiella pneumoniae]|nr:hypothetical protein MJ575_23950 [Klebsiella pneumoniae]
MIAHDAERFGIDLRLCGEMAGDPMCVTILISSVATSVDERPLGGEVKYLLRRIDIEEAQELSRSQPPCADDRRGAPSRWRPLWSVVVSAA